MSASPHLAPAERRAWRGITTINAKLLRRLSRQLQRDSGLSSADYEVCVNLDKAEGGRMRVLELATVMEWEKSRLSKHLSRMVQRGHLARERCATDSRGAVVVLTPAGRSAFTAAEPIHLAHVRDLFLDALTPEQLEVLGDVSDSVLGHIAAIDARTVATGAEPVPDTRPQGTPELKPA